MSNPLRHYDWANWLAGLFAAIIGGGANAASAAIALNVSDPAHFNAQNAKFFEILAWIFATSALTSGLMYLKQSPIPKIIEETTTTTTVKVEKTPPGGAQSA